MRAWWPSISLAMAVVLASSPGAAGPLPVAALMPVAVIFFWSIQRGAVLPALVVFGCGLLLDELSHGPVGYWALIYVVVALCAGSIGEFTNGGWLARTAMLTVCLGVACAVQVAVLTAFGAEPTGLADMVLAVAIVVVAYPAAGWVLALGGTWTRTADRARFEPPVRS